MADKNPDPETIRAQLAAEEEKRSIIDKQREALNRRIEELRAELVHADDQAHDAIPPQDFQPNSPSTTKEKVALFRSLFRGRTDVFPKRWENPKKGTTGYSPACANEWVPHLCDKPRVKCGDCPNQNFIPVTDQIILEHLQGRYVIGVYPLLHNDNCLFLAVDFDKGAWQKDVEAFVSTCGQHSVPVAVERSRSGNGAHAWIFFQEPVSAQQARAMGSFLITRTMANRYEMTMDSYDRLFPNQDTMPKGGFGNLIALPFQDGPRQEKNSVFIDMDWQPYENQWQYLASVRRLSADEVAGLVREATETGQVIGEFFDNNDNDSGSTTPWVKRPSNTKDLPVASDNLPSKIQATLAQLLYVEKAGLPSPLLNQIKRLAAFQNPEYHKKQAMRLSTALVPRVISCSEDHPEHIGLPRGCRDDLETLLAEYNIDLEVEDLRNSGKPLDVCFCGDLTPIQKPAVKSILAHDTGVFVAPPGTGKTVVGINLIASRAVSTMVLVHRLPLLEQWVGQLAAFLKINSKEVGQIGGGKRKPNGRLDVVMIQSLVRGANIDEMVSQYGHVIVDECHHVPAVSFERVMREVTAKYITGLTATPQRRDGHHPILRLQLGPIRHTIAQKALAADRSFKFRLVPRKTEFKLPAGSETTTIQEIYRALALDKVRNDLIINDVITAVDEGRSPLLLTERREHLDLLADRLKGFVRNLVIMHGGMGAKQRRKVADQLAGIPANEERLILATGRFIGEGYDDARLDTLFLAMPVSWKGTLEQYAGRLHRSYADKTEVRIVDYVDGGVPVLERMFAKRMRGYRSLGYHEADLF